MRAMPRVTVAFLAGLVSLPAVAVQKISGIVFTEGKADKVTVRVWALGEPLLAKPALADMPVAEAAVAPGSAFTLDLPDGALPVRVEVAAAGHTGAAFTVALPEQAALPPLWLPSGTELKVRVMADGKPAAGSRVTGQITLRGPRVEPNRWQPVVPTTEADAKGEAKVWLPAQGSLALSGRGREGRWGALSQRPPTPASAVLQLDSRPVSVVVRDQRGEPVRGARVSGASAPGPSVVTNEQGRAVVQVAGKGDVEIVAVGPGVVGRTVRHALPVGEVVLTAEPLREIEVQWTGTQGPALLEPEWIPRAVRGGAPIGGRGGQVRILFVHGGGTLTVWSPGTAAQMVRVEAAEPAVAVRLVPGARVEGLVVEAGDVPAAGVPVWCAQGFRWPGLPRQFARDASRLERPILPSTVTGSGGGFTLSDLAAGALRLTARRAGLPPADSGPLEAAAGTSQRVTLRLERGTWLALQLRDPDGRPLGGVSVSAYRDEERRRRGGAIRLMFGPLFRRDEPLAAGTTDREGVLRLQSVPAGDLNLELKLSGYVTRWLDVTLAG